MSLKSHSDRFSSKICSIIFSIQNTLLCSSVSHKRCLKILYLKNKSYHLQNIFCFLQQSVKKYMFLLFWEERKLLGKCMRYCIKIVYSV